MHTTNGLLEARIDELMQGVLVAAREVALAAVAEAFARNGDLRGAGNSRQHAHPRRMEPSPERGRRRRPGKKRSPDELMALSAKFCRAVDKKSGETMAYYARELGSTAVALAVPVRRLIEEGRVRSVGERNQRRYYAGTVQ